MKKVYISIIVAISILFVGCVNNAKVVSDVNRSDEDNKNNTTIENYNSDMSINSTDDGSISEHSDYVPQYDVDVPVIDSTNDRFMVEMTYTPSFTLSLGVDYVQAMANNPIDVAFNEEWALTDGW